MIAVKARTGRRNAKVVRYQCNQQWDDIGGKKSFYRSDWERQFARHLEWLKQNNLIQDWEHEPQTFWFNKILRGIRSYLPDFKVINSDGSHYWVEVKGYMDTKSATKIKRFRKYYPQEQLVIIDGEWFKKNIWKKE